ncbi:TauD-domain-containing protein [Lentithecium fluviatile CBS 122367]|uniref:TauD-domain-containing protein n=1 Tax=Lentithecium fluviatile CBS 122367 TaxID=1168545 RepID=A0A6G1IKB9_9PLEO|nr:TauD-domain-containing protein [Lentithecium fluviatile CBS 122367]
MATGILSDDNVSKQDSRSSVHTPKPFQPTGILDKFDYEEVTPIIGREFPTLKIVDDLLNADNADELLRELAITVSRRGVVFFRAQNNLTNDLQKILVNRLGQLTGKPLSSTLHIHPVYNQTSEFGARDDEISTISSSARKQIFANALAEDKRKYDAAQWHSDIQFEPHPADYTSLRLVQLPKDERGVPTGGDTLWASGYEIYDRFSPAYRKFLESLTAVFSGDGFLKAAAANPEKIRIHEGPRGSPENVGRELASVHPVVRTNPVTGWKSVFALGPFPKRVNELYSDESEELLKKILGVVTANHDLQVRFKWKSENDLAIWDNRSVFHTATFDYDHLGERFGHRAVGIGERPYFDVNSKSRTQALAEEAQAKANVATSKAGEVNKKEIASSGLDEKEVPAPELDSVVQEEVASDEANEKAEMTSKADAPVQDQAQIVSKEDDEKAKLPVRKVDSPVPEEQVVSEEASKTDLPVRKVDSPVQEDQVIGVSG